MYYFYTVFIANLHQCYLIVSYLINVTVKVATFDLVQKYHFWCEAIKPSNEKLEVLLLSTHWNSSLYDLSSRCYREEVSVWKML